MQARVLKLYAAHEEAGLEEAAGAEAAGAEALAPHADHADPADAQVRASPDHPPPTTHPHPTPTPAATPTPTPTPHQARLEHAKALRAEAPRLETTYGFCS